MSPFLLGSSVFAALKKAVLAYKNKKTVNLNSPATNEEVFFNLI